MISSTDDAIQILNALIENKTITLDQINQVSKKQSNNNNNDNSDMNSNGNKNVNGNSNSSSNNKKNNDESKTKSKKKEKKKKKKNQKPKTQYMTRHVAFRFHYDGATYNGLAENRNVETDNSVEKALFAALQKTCLIDNDCNDIHGDNGGNDGGKDKKRRRNEVDNVNGNDNDGNDDGVLIVKENEGEGEKITCNGNIKNSRDECNYSRSGRTDKGVSAFGQVIALKVRSAFPIGTMITTSDTDNGNDSNNNKSDESNLNLDPKMRIMQESDMPKNSSNQVDCWVPTSASAPTSKSTSAPASKSSMKQRIITEKNFCQMLNNVLPTSIRILGWSPVSNDFSARFSTSSRTYRYFFIQRDLNLNNMQKALDNMVGAHDFRNLCKMNCEEVDNFVRVIKYGKIVKTTLTSAIGNIDNDNDNQNHFRRPCYFEIQGQAFLWHQIRCIASILFMVGKGLEPPTVVNELLDIKANPAKPSYPFAVDLPLVLHKCDYKNLNFGHTVQSLWKVSCDLESKWEELTLAAERLRNGMDSLGTDSLVCTSDVVAFINALIADRQKKLARSTSSLKIMDKLPSLELSEKEVVKRLGSHISWGKALNTIDEYGGGKPGIEGSKVPLHVPLMQRARGSTYEEKIKSILATDERFGAPPSKRRREIYENNIKKKKVSKEEDEAFYKKMLSEGGSGV